MPLQPDAEAWNNGIIADYREHAGQLTIPPFVGATLLLLTTTGAKTGQSNTSPVGYMRDGPRYVVVGSNSGGPTNPAWFYNVMTEPLVTVEVGSETFRARARVTEGSERRRLFDIHAAAIPQFAKYEQMTDRELPVVVLERIDEA